MARFPDRVSRTAFIEVAAALSATVALGYAALGNRRQPVPGRILANQDCDYAHNSVVSVPIGTGALGWFSGYPARTLRATGQREQPVEENRFSLPEFSSKDLWISHFKWHPGMGEDAIDKLEPFATIALPV